MTEPWMTQVGARFHQFNTFDKETMSYYTLGKRSDPAVLLLHSFRSSSKCWFTKGSPHSSGLAVDLADAGYFVVALDLRGHGKSACPIDPGKYAEQQELYDIVALLSQLKLHQFAVVGYSHGSFEAAKLLTISDRVACAVLGGVGDRLTDTQWHSDYSVNTVAVALEARARGENAEKAVQSAGGIGAMVASIEHISVSVAAKSLLALAGVQRGQSITTPEEISKILVPVLCINGRSDNENGSKERLARLFTNGRLSWVDGDHATAVNDPQFCEQIRNFLSENYPARDLGPSKKRRTSLNPQPACTCAVMDASEASSITIDFDAIEDGLKDLLKEKGSVIVTNVLDPADIAELEVALKLDMQELIDGTALAASDSSVQAAYERVQREGLHSWPAASLADVGARGRFQDHGMPHGRFAWKCRTNPRVKRVYEILHGTSDMVVSIDNAFVANRSQVEVSTNPNWPHVDQNDHDARVPCHEWDVYQGLLYVWSSTTSHSSTTVVWPESHKEPYADYMSDSKVQERIAKGKPHFTLISAMEPGEVRDRLIHGWDAGARRMPVPAGGLLLWTSRTTHQGWSGGPRLAQPLCWEPRSRRDEIMRERKLRLAALGLPSTHWASLALPHELSDLCRPDAVKAIGSDDQENIHFPLRREIRSQALMPNADISELWLRLQSPDWFTPLLVGEKELLESSIRDAYKKCL